MQRATVLGGGERFLASGETAGAERTEEERLGEDAAHDLWDVMMEGRGLMSY